MAMMKDSVIGTFKIQDQVQVHQVIEFFTQTFEYSDRKDHVRRHSNSHLETPYSGK